MPLLLIALLLAASPAGAGQQITYPVSVPPECVELAQREHVPTLIENRYQAVKARLKLARLSSSDPMVAQCKQAVERLRASMKS
jgi:hypothetical protein